MNIHIHTKESGFSIRAESSNALGLKNVWGNCQRAESDDRIKATANKRKRLGKNFFKKRCQHESHSKQNKTKQNLRILYEGMTEWNLQWINEKKFKSGLKKTMAAWKPQKRKEKNLLKELSKKSLQMFERKAKKKTRIHIQIQLR